MANDSELMPKALTNFVFDLFDSVTLSQIPDEQSKFYSTDFKDLSQKYFSNQAWPSPQTIATECNGDPLFLAVYRELTHRHWHAVSRPTLRDRIEGWQVYRELFEEILDADATNFYLLPCWVFDILNEFVYQYQGFCQIRTAVYVSARKYGLLNPDGTRTNSSTSTANQHLIDNLNTLEGATDTWDVEAIFSYLHRLTNMGWPNKEGKEVPPVYTYLSIFGAVSTARLECLLGDYSASLQALTPLAVHGNYVIPKDMEDNDRKFTVQEALNSVLGARVSIAYHAGVSLLLLRRYKDAIRTLGDMCSTLQRGFKTGQLRPFADQYNKQYDRMLALLSLLCHICPAPGLVEDSVVRAMREKHGSKLEAATSYEEWFQSPKFISTDPNQAGAHRQQIQHFLQEMQAQPAARALRSYLRLYSSVPLSKLAHFHDQDTEAFLPLLLAYKLRMRQLESNDGGSVVDVSNATYKTALDIHYYVQDDIVHVDEAEKPRRFENFFVAQIQQDHEIRQDAEAVDTQV